MKIAVIGGSGLIGSKLVTKLREGGHDVVAASPNSGVNSITGEGLAPKLGADCFHVGSSLSLESSAFHHRARNVVRLAPVLIQPIADDDVAAASSSEGELDTSTTTEAPLSDGPARIALCVEPLSNELVEPELLGSSHFDDAIHRLAHRHPHDRTGQVPAIWILLLVTCAVAKGAHVALAGPADRAPHPLPKDTLHVRMADVGTHGGRFVVAQTSAPKTFNPLMGTETSTTDVTNHLFVSLVGFDRQSHEMIPSLAKSWESSSDALTWTLRLRRGARFSDGHEITSADVLFSFEVCYDAKLHLPMQSLLTVGGRKMEVSAVDPHTVRVRLPERYALILQALSAVTIVPKHVLEAPYRQGRFAAAYNTSTKPESLVTSGAFRLAQYVPNEKVVLTPNPYWYGVDARGRRLPYLDELVFLIVPDLNTAFLQFEAGTVDGLEQVNPQDYRHYEENQRKGNYTLHDLGPVLGVGFVFFNLNRARESKPGTQAGAPYVGAKKYAWFSSPVFRRAVSHAIDRDAIIRSAYFGEGAKNWSVAPVADKIWHTPDVTGADYDPAESRRLLAGLGLRDHDGDGVLEDGKGHPVSFTLQTSAANPVAMQMCVLIQDDLAKVGIRCVPSGADFNTLVTHVYSDFQYDAVLFGFQPGVPPDPGMNQNFFKSSGATHSWNVRQPRPETVAEATIDSLVAVNVSTSDPATRKRTWSEIQKTLNRENFLIWLPIPRWKVPIRNRFGNIQPSVIPPRILWNASRVYVKHPGSTRATR